MSAAPILKIEDLKVHFKVNQGKTWPWQPSKTLKAVDGVNFELYAGETLGVVGESGCGKSTLARAILGLLPSQNGRVLWLGEDLRELDKKSMREKRRQLQVIFQDPLASLNPRMTVGEIIAEPLNAFYPEKKKAEVMAEVKAMMKLVGLLPNQVNRYPHEFSGGQCQRIGIARALILKPKMIVCDEPVSALDVSIQAQIVNLLRDLQKKLDLSLIFIAHDLSIVKHISDRVLVMYLGHIMEIADKDDLFDSPEHPYTQALMSAVPVPDPEKERTKKLELLQGDLPSPISPPSGCVFRTRCPRAVDACGDNVPELQAARRSQAACIRLHE
ncbi:murein tripeptide/oligopeptide ABC transporter ATP binding protein OppF [Piscirickettsia litoralis]|uniref:Oligopeptide ABC transporter ATP-binding protein OppF n=1 Tax=Piscirickettsia litoralis TaxID=1891921 RepID=A0ABX3A3P5_9GAMM|nr:murein tripeptide/oligopeptide ABC transporter ATP binding protein OppF [Piscirickettsia litoralis]ODN43496.1 oligopeptide ABC transporter ATP-binding protein OppF [Piscirickettsia litoralis]